MDRLSLFTIKGAISVEKIKKSKIFHVFFMLFLTGFWNAFLTYPAFSAPSETTAFSRFAKVNNNVITHYEYAQRILMLQAFGVKNNVEQRAKKELIEESLKNAEAERLGISISEDKIRAAMEQYAVRFNLDLDKLLSILSSQGVKSDTLRDFVKANSLWQRLIQMRLQSDFDISEEEIDRANFFTNIKNSSRIKLFEIALLARDETERTAALNFLNEIVPTIKTKEDFMDMARLHSVAPSMTKGGDIGWIALNEISSSIASQLIELNIGEISKPIQQAESLIILFIDDFDEPILTPPKGSVLDYAIITIPSIQTKTALRMDDTRIKEVKYAVDNCNDLYGYAARNPDVTIDFKLEKYDAIAKENTDILDWLDPHEFSTAVEMKTKKGKTAQRLLMLCQRITHIDTEQRTAIKQALANRHAENFAASYIDMLRANAIITYAK